MKPAFCLPLLFANVESIHIRHLPGVSIGPIDEETRHLSRRSQPYNGYGYFDQPIDHANPKLGTFKQRYWYGTEFWNGSGSPIIVFLPGEQSGEGFNTTFFGTRRLTGVFARDLGGAVIILEHRYWGKSSPYPLLTVKNLQHLTLENSVKDLSYFAKNFVPPFDPSGGSGPDKAPWILSGGSYPGSLAAWSAVLDPGVFWAYHATSAVVQMVSDFWTYFVPEIQASPKNCSADIQAVVAHVDEILAHGSNEEKRDLKLKFSLESVSDADFGGALAWGPYMWQGSQFFPNMDYPRSVNPFHWFCDHVEGLHLRKNGSSKTLGPDGVGLTTALEGYAQWFNQVLLPGFCASYKYPSFQGRHNTACFQQENPSNPSYTDLSINNPSNRQWFWLLCNSPLELWPTGSPSGMPTFVSRLLTPEWYRIQCALSFPPEIEESPTTGENVTYTYGLQQGKTAGDVNRYTGGWLATNGTRIMYVNGEFDPWREATVSARGRPSGPLKSEGKMSVREVKGGFHCSDYFAENWEVNEGLKVLKDEMVEEMRGWIGEFYEMKGTRAQRERKFSKEMQRNVLR